MKTEEEILAEIEAMKEIKDRIVPQSIFGTDNILQFDAGLDVLENDLDEDDICNKYDMDDDYEVYSAAHGVREWMDGESDVRPSEDFPLIN